MSQKWGGPSASLRMALPHLCQAHPLRGWAQWLVYTGPHLRRTLGRAFVPSSHVPCKYFLLRLNLKFSRHNDSYFNLDNKVRTLYPEYNFQNLLRKKQALRNLSFSFPLSLFSIPFPPVPRHLCSVLKACIRYHYLPGNYQEYEDE